MLPRKPDLTLIIDVSSILFKIAAVQTTGYQASKSSQYAGELDPQDLVGLCMHISLQSIHKWFRLYKPDFVIFAFEGGSNWRKQYTKEHNLNRQYKGNRVVDPAMAHYYELIDSFKETMSQHTSVCCLSVPDMEADDAIAAYCQLTDQTGEQVVIISSDRDFVQLMKMPHVKLIEPEKGKLRNTIDDKEHQADLDYWLFLKCIRGDAGDNVASAFPRVRETKIKEAYADPYKRVNFMNEKWVDEHNVEHRVGDLFEHNRVLVDLACQPEKLRESLLLQTKAQVGTIKNYSHFHFLRFLGKYKLTKVAEEANRFVDLFSNNQLFLNGSKLRTEASIVKNTETPTQLTGLLF